MTAASTPREVIARSLLEDASESLETWDEIDDDARGMFYEWADAILVALADAHLYVEVDDLSALYRKLEPQEESP